MKKIYEGWLSIHSYGEADDILFLTSCREPLAEELGWIKGKSVSIRYWITDVSCSMEEARAQAQMHIMGVARTDFGARYSEITGYLWTDEELNVGGHDLLAQLKSEKGKYLIMEIET